jgi:hypothetical protein
LPKMKDMPKEMGGSGITLPEGSDNRESVTA